MIYRKNLKCNICKKVYTFRISIGSAKIQKHEIYCASCKELLGIELYLDQNNGNLIRETLINCKQTEESGQICNLDPTHIVPKQLSDIDMISVPLILFNHEEALKNEEMFSKAPKFIQEEFVQKNKLRQYIDQEWDDLKPCWSQLIKGNVENAQKIAIEKTPKYGKTVLPHEWIFNFSQRLLNRQSFNIVPDLLAKVFPLFKGEALGEFLTYHNQNLYYVNLRNYFEVFDAFFKNFTLFNPLLLAYETNKTISAGELPSTNFNDVKKFYGDAYEAFGTGIDTVALLSNVYKGRRFDTFEKMTLKEYYNLKKSRKNNCFEDIPEFKAVILSFRNDLRNGSHHGSMHLDPDTMMISYGPKEFSSKKQITYFDYIDECVKIFISCNIMLNIELVLNLTGSKIRLY